MYKILFSWEASFVFLKLAKRFTKNVFLITYLGCTSCDEILVTFKGEPRKGHQNKKKGYYTIMHGYDNGRDVWSSIKNDNGQYFIWYSNLFKKWAIGSENEKNADIYNNSSLVHNEVLAGIVSEENFLECPFDLRSEKWSYYSDLGMARAEENEINIACSKPSKNLLICFKH